MPGPKLTRLELQIMETLWTRGEASIRLETKGVVRRVKKVGNFHIFAAAVSRNAAQRRLVDDLLSLFGGRTQPVMAHLIESGKLTLQDVKEAEKTLRKMSKESESAS